MAVCVMILGKSICYQSQSAAVTVVIVRDGEHFAFAQMVSDFQLVLGGMFMAMPLAIIGNEYDTVWTKVTEERKRRKREQLGEQQRQDEARLGLGSGCQQGQMPPITEEDELEEKADEDDPHIKLALLPSEQKEKLRKLSHGRQKGSDASATAALTSSAEKLPSSTDDLIHSVRFDVDGNNAGDVENNSNDYSSSSLDSEESFDISDDSDDSDENDFQVSENLPMDVLLCPLMVCYVQLLSCLDRLKKELSNTENSGNAGKLDNTLLLLHFGELRGWVPNLHFQLTAIYNQLTGSHESRRSSTVSAVHDVIGNKGGLAASNAVDSHSEQNHMFHYAEGSNSDSSDDEKDAAETFKQNLRRGSVALPSMMLQGSNLGMANRSNPLTGAKRLSSVAPSDGDNMASATHGGNNGISNVSSPFIRNNNVDHGSTGNAVATILSAPFLNRRLKSTMLSFIIPNRPSTTTSSVSPSVPSNSSGHYTSGVGSSDKREKIDGDDPMDRRQLFAQAAKQESFMSRVTGFGSLLTLVNGIAGDDVNHERELRKKNVDDEFLHKVEMVSKDPTALRSRIWIMLELPFSSNEARMLQYIFILLITTSVFVLFTQAVVNLSQYGESTEICGKVVELYCSDKIDSQMDPGCYVQMLNRTTNAVFTSSERLQFRCESHNCFGYGNNFGASVTNVTCSNPSYSPFQTKDDLEYTYRSPYVFTTRARMHMINPICTRIECKENIGSYNGNPVWIGFEFITNLVFTIEIVLRMVVSDSVLEYLNNTMNIFDILSILPFYIVLGRSKTITNLDFSILASSPEPVIFVILRSFQVSAATS